MLSPPASSVEDIPGVTYYAAYLTWRPERSTSSFGILQKRGLSRQPLAHWSNDDNGSRDRPGHAFQKGVSQRKESSSKLLCTRSGWIQERPDAPVKWMGEARGRQQRPIGNTAERKVRNDELPELYPCLVVSISRFGVGV